MEQVTVYRMKYDELDRLVNEHYGKRDWESVAQFKWNNYSSYEATADLDLDEYAREKLARFAASPADHPANCSFSLYHILSALAGAGKIPAGSYIVKVYW